jgi:hypothetical protein
MKEQILKIIDELKVILTGEYPFNVEIDSKKKAAEEITSHIMKFIEWLTDFSNHEIDRVGTGWRILTAKEYFKERNIEEVYQYWLTEINKES